MVTLLLSAMAHASQTLGDETYYFGDLHSHTGYSLDAGSTDVGSCPDPDTCGAFAEVFADARRNGLDFLALSDHINGFRTMSDGDWPTYLAAILAADDQAGGFVTIPGGEIWTSDDDGQLGHTTLLLWEEADVLAPLTIDEARHGPSERLTDCAAFSAWITGLAASFGAISLIPHHPATADPMPTDWRCFDAAYSPAVEVYSRHGNSLEGASAWDVPGAGVWAQGYVATALDPDQYGLSFGFVGGTDGHDTRPGATCQLDGMQATHLYGGGLTAVVMESDRPFARKAIHDALIARRSYATSGPMVPLAITWTADGEEIGELGAILEVDVNATLGVEVHLAEPDTVFVDDVRVVGPRSDWVLEMTGADSWSAQLPASEVPEWLYVRVELDGSAYYGTAGCDDGGDDSDEFLWASPSFFTVSGTPDPDTGDSGDSGQSGDSEPTVTPPDPPCGCGVGAPAHLLVLLGGLAVSARRRPPGPRPQSRSAAG